MLSERGCVEAFACRGVLPPVTVRHMGWHAGATMPLDASAISSAGHCMLLLLVLQGCAEGRASCEFHHLPQLGQTFGSGASPTASGGARQVAHARVGANEALDTMMHRLKGGMLLHERLLPHRWEDMAIFCKCDTLAHVPTACPGEAAQPPPMPYIPSLPVAGNQWGTDAHVAFILLVRHWCVYICCDSAVVTSHGQRLQPVE
jgi:hypothetical protein